MCSRARRARHHRRRHLGRHGRRGDRCLCRPRPRRTDIFILFPEGKVSPVQQRQMTTSHADNVHALAIRGNFDDCQALVKDMFNDVSFRDRVQLSGVNSINWARIMAQIVYYFTAAVALGAPDRKVSFTVPTGNSAISSRVRGDEDGLPIARLVVATNENDILSRTLKTGRYEMRAVKATTSPSMDIRSPQFRASSVRKLWPRRRPGAQRHGRLKQSGAFEIEKPALTAIRKHFPPRRPSENQWRRRSAPCWRQPACCSIRIRRSASWWRRSSSAATSRW